MALEQPLSDERPSARDAAKGLTIAHVEHRAHAQEYLNSEKASEMGVFQRSRYDHSGAPLQRRSLHDYEHGEISLILQP
jgi:hypothetical protein